MATISPSSYSSTNESALLRRRLSHARQYTSTDVNGFMSGFSLGFRFDPTAASSADAASMSMAIPTAQGHLPTTMPPTAIAPGDLLNFPTMPDSASFGMEPKLIDPFARSTCMSGGTFGTFGWPMPSQALPAHVEPSAVTRMQSHSSYSSYISNSSSNMSNVDSEPWIKAEADSPTLFPLQTTSASSPASSSLSETPPDTKPVVFTTDIDTLLKTIQSKSPTRPDQQPPPTSNQQNPQPRKRETALTTTSTTTTQPKTKTPTLHTCPHPPCTATFAQKTHLTIHTRTHTGLKPYPCPDPTCTQTFSQRGNLKTHIRRHTGERPYECEVCGKRFAQRGNVRAHAVVHSEGLKPFVCRLDGCGNLSSSCSSSSSSPSSSHGHGSTPSDGGGVISGQEGRRFTQLGNLKAHQNRFHGATIRRLRERFEGLRAGDTVGVWEKEMWEYFGGLYRNCNRGIKGRGRGRGSTVRDGVDVGDGLGERSRERRRDSVIESGKAA
ncbi:hypothetical protein B0A50_02076 [Salinomyces thailandicus]|uniref:C2H2-type domain-containing protein n=1 Tax=Salinomyces thailandicus TaxID=706561 RepID=A0A4U0U7U3_9PEZI|nr:hypothetical protein B0A50_02076 [Salinomyces thailandica]